MKKRIAPKKEKISAIDKLTKRERDVLHATCLGYTSKDIAIHYDISHHTVEMHRKNLINKLNARNTANLIYRAGSLGIIRDLDL